MPLSLPLNFTPYPYQVQAIDKILEWTNEDDRSHANTFVSLIQSGKTFCCCGAIGELYRQGKRVWVIVDREELIEQWWDSFFELNPDVSKKGCWYIADGKTPMYHKQIQFVQVQTLTRRFSKIDPKHKPDVVFLDEAHGVGFQEVFDKVNLEFDPKVICVTATPVRHGKSKQQYIDKFPLWEFPNPKNPLKGTGRMYWHIGATSKMMLELKRWKQPNWLVASDDLSEMTSKRFAGVRINSANEYNPTDQASVMIDLLPLHIAEWKLNGGESRSSIWYCVNKEHCIETVKALIKEGRKVALVLSKMGKETEAMLNSMGVVTNRKKAIKMFRAGELTDLVNCQCLTTGFSASLASCAVWLRRTMSVGLFCQMAGRALTYHSEFNTALLMDFAGNLGVHKVFPQLIDWLDFNPNKLMFADVNQVVCRSCKRCHKGNPKPTHPDDKRIKFSTKLGDFVYPENYKGRVVQVDTEDEIRCEYCYHPVYFNEYKLALYSAWLTEVKHAAMSGEKPPKFKGDSAGISIGMKHLDISQKLRVSDMYTSGIWSLVGPNEAKGEYSCGEGVASGPKDRSIAWGIIRDDQLKALDGLTLRAKKLSKLSEKQRNYLEFFDVSEIIKLDDTEGKYRTALGYMYIGDKSPIKSFSYWEGEDKNPPSSLVRMTLEKIYQGDEENYELLRNWIQKHHELSTDHAKKGILRGMMKELMSLK